MINAFLIKLGLIALAGGSIYWWWKNSVRLALYIGIGAAVVVLGMLLLGC